MLCLEVSSCNLLVYATVQRACVCINDSRPAVSTSGSHRVSPIVPTYRGISAAYEAAV